MLSLVTKLRWLHHEIVFSCLRNCSGCKVQDFRDEGREFQHIDPETAKVWELNVTVRVHGKFRSPWLQPECDDEL